MLDPLCIANIQELFETHIREKAQENPHNIRTKKKCAIFLITSNWNLKTEEWMDGCKVIKVGCQINFRIPIWDKLHFQMQNSNDAANSEKKMCIGMLKVTADY